jgi:alpha-ketoglutarate-dependent 2,4-dichlorophenoxyacetate dioxygenase
MVAIRGVVLGMLAVSGHSIPPARQDKIGLKKSEAPGMQVTPLQSTFAAEITGVDLSGPQSQIPYDAIKKALDRYAVCVVRNTVPPTDEQHVAFSKRLGPIEKGKTFTVKGDGPKRIADPDIVDVSNLNPDGTIMPSTARRHLFKKGDKLWHNDMSFIQNRATYSLLLGHEIPPEGGNTEFCDLRAAYDALPEEKKETLENLVAHHSIWNSRRVAGFPEPTPEEVEASSPPAYHRLVQVHETSKRKTLYIAAHASHILGWPVEEGRALLKELMRFATRPQFVYSHEWRLGDLLIWDNRCTMHRATDFDDQKYRRDMRRTTCRERPVSQFAQEISSY